MKAKRTIALGAILMLLATALIPQAAMAGPKRRIAILPFEYGAVSSSLGGYDLGKGVASLLITKLVNDGTYSIIDRQHLDAILKEQNFSVSDRADASTANKIGKMLGVDAVVYGTITAFGFEDKRTSYSAPSVYVPVSIPYVGGLGSMFGGLHGSSRKQKARTAVDATVTDTNTGEILAAVHGLGESTKASSSFGSYDVDSSDFSSSLAGEATNQAVEQMGTQLISMAAKIPDNQSLALQNVEGRVADVTGREVIVNVGKQNGIAAGDHLSVDRPYKTIKDPVTGKTLKEMSSTIALIKIKEVNQDNSTGDITKGGGVKVGDAVKKVTTDVTAIIISPLPDAGGGGAIGTTHQTRTMTTSGTVLKKETTK